MWEDRPDLLILKKERDRLFAIKGDDVLKLSHAEQYQRMRFEREIEGNEYVKLLKAGYTYKEAAKLARINADKVVANWNENCSIWNLYHAQGMICT
jgi:hypothetical protein